MPSDLPPGLVEAVAEAIFATEYGDYSPDFHPDHNRWTWQGDGHPEQFKDYYRTYARAAVAAMVEHLGLTEETCCEQAYRDREEFGKYSVYTCADLGRSCRTRLVSRWTEVNHGSE